MPENVEAVHIWILLDSYARDYAGMDGWPMRIRLEAARAECEHTIDPVGNLRKVLILETIIYPAKYRRKETRNTK